MVGLNWKKQSECNYQNKWQGHNGNQDIRPTKKKTKKTGVALQESVASTMEALYTHFRAGGL